ncbi:MAG: hypothetical protein VX278_14335, partial [Myxococcota bacterium]|nr:hypothetical protein [Myxococcota bacterium]
SILRFFKPLEIHEVINGEYALHVNMYTNPYCSQSKKILSRPRVIIFDCYRPYPSFENTIGQR